MTPRKAKAAKTKRRGRVSRRVLPACGLVVPPVESKGWPTLGEGVCDWIEDNLVFGPGDLRGQPARLDPEKRALIYRIYEVYPRTDPQAGRRRFKRVALSLMKGSAKTEFAAWLAAAELDPLAPVRCVEFDRRGRPRGDAVTDPYIPMVAYTEEQSEELGYGALRVILELSEVADHFDIGLERIMRVGGDGKAVALASAPNARDGARTTFQHFDETHRFTLPKLKAAHQTMLANVPKRKLADAWSLETTTAPAPGTGSVAEDTMEYARAVQAGIAEDSKLFFFHRQAPEDADWSTKKGIRKAVLQAAGPQAPWRDIDGIVDQFDDPKADRNFLRRVWGNQLVQETDRAFDAALWGDLHRKNYAPEDGALVVLGFDGARTQDATALIGTEVPTGFQFVLGIWERPFDAKSWEVPEQEVNEVLEAAYDRWVVWRVYADPPFWESTIATWQGEHGVPKGPEDAGVAAWPTYRTRKMVDAVRAYVNAMITRQLSHDGDERHARHIGNAYKRPTSIRDDHGHPLWVIQKARHDSPLKIDAAMAGILSWEGRRDALAAGVWNDEPSVYDQRVEAGEDPLFVIE